jgi:hypothetical protein
MAKLSRSAVVPMLSERLPLQRSSAVHLEAIRLARSVVTNFHYAPSSGSKRGGRPQLYVFQIVAVHLYFPSRQQLKSVLIRFSGYPPVVIG